MQQPIHLPALLCSSGQGARCCRRRTMQHALLLTVHAPCTHGDHTPTSPPTRLSSHPPLLPPVCPSLPTLFIPLLQAESARLRDARDAASAAADGARADCEALRLALRGVEARLSEYQRKDAEVGAWGQPHGEGAAVHCPYRQLIHAWSCSTPQLSYPSGPTCSCPSDHAALPTFPTLPALPALTPSCSP